MSQLESEVKQLKAERQELAREGISKVEGDVVRNLVSTFLQEFAARFEQADIIERKELLRKVIEKIEVNPDKKSVRCYVRRVPRVLVGGEIEGKLEGVLGADSSANGNRTRILALRGLRPNR